MSRTSALPTTWVPCVSGDACCCAVSACTCGCCCCCCTAAVWSMVSVTAPRPARTASPSPWAVLGVGVACRAVAEMAAAEAAEAAGIRRLRAMLACARASWRFLDALAALEADAFDARVRLRSASVSGGGVDGRWWHSTLAAPLSACSSHAAMALSRSYASAQRSTSLHSWSFWWYCTWRVVSRCLSVPLVNFVWQASHMP